jgi:predicted nuclease of predicted toxin-antitoxin system
VRFLVDADLPPVVAVLLDAEGHDGAYVPDLFPPKTPDPEIAAYARRAERCIITRDFGFADMRRYLPREHHGIIVLTVPPECGTQYILNLVRELLAHLAELQPLHGKLLIVDPGRIRVRE